MKATIIRLFSGKGSGRLTTYTPSVVVGEICVQWASCISSRDTEKAKELKEKLDELLPTMEQDDKIIAYVQLLNFRYDMLTEVAQKQDYVVPEFADIPVDSLLQFYKFYFVGQYEFYYGRYKSAISLYNKAEAQLAHVHDENEKAEFYHHVGMSYYRIDQYTHATSYLEKAIHIFEGNPAYEERLINSKMGLGGIATDLHQYENGEKYYLEAVNHASNYPVTKALAFRALGLSKMKQQDFEKAKSYFIKALAIPEHQNSIFGMKSKANLANILYRLCDPNAQEIYEQAYGKANQFGNMEYIIRLDLTYYLYDTYNENLLDKKLNELIDLKLNYVASSIAEEISYFAKEKGDLKTALKFMTTAYEKRIDHQMLGGEQT